MKIALCFSGQPRDIDIIYPIIKQTILDSNDVDVFVHTWWDPDNLSHNSVIPDRTHKTFSTDAIDKIKNLYQPKRIMVEKPKVWKRNYEITEKQLDEGPGWARDVDGGLEVGKLDPEESEVVVPAFAPVGDHQGAQRRRGHVAGSPARRRSTGPRRGGRTRCRR